jgi:hypothetical protein
MINRRQFLKWTGYMVAAAAVVPSALVASPKLSKSSSVTCSADSSTSYESVDYRAQAKEQLAEWMSQKWSEAIYKEATRKSYFSMLL